jgi:hypothetical protein
MNIFYTVTCHIVCPRYVPGFLWGEEISRDRSAKGLSAALWHPVFSFFQPCTVYMMQIESSSPRRYPSGFGMALLNGYLKSCEGEFRRDLRKKFELDPSMSDREIFNRYPLLADQWMDASLPEIFFYLSGCNHLVIPDSWHDSMDDFKNQLVNLIVSCSSWNPKTLLFGVGFSSLQPVPTLCPFQIL